MNNVLKGNIQLISTGIPDLLPQTDRTPNVPHISTIIKQLCIIFGHYDEEQQLISGDDFYIANRSRMELGKALERSIISGYQEQYPDEYYTPAEINYDGLYGHPDILNLKHSAVCEIKLTWRTAKSGSNGNVDIGDFADIDHPIYSDKFWRDWTQIKAYCKMLNYNIGQLMICHVLGAYDGYKDEKTGKSKLPDVIFNVWQQRFTNYELSMNWKLLKSQSERMEW